jgi:hypothetical protein
MKSNSSSKYEIQGNEKNSESFMEYTQASKLIMEKIEEYMIDSEEEQRYFI